VLEEVEVLLIAKCDSCEMRMYRQCDREILYTMMVRILDQKVQPGGLPWFMGQQGSKARNPTVVVLE
jgi:hypothetical protein